MLEMTYLFAVLSMAISGIYIVQRCKLRITSTSMIICGIFLFHGPAYIYYMFEPNTTPIFRKMKATPLFNDAIISLNISLGLMFLLVIVGAELVNVSAKRHSMLADNSIRGWDEEKATAGPPDDKHFLVVVLALAIGMLAVSIYENHVGVILQFIGSEEKDVTRATTGGSDFYVYRLAISSIAPMMAAWCLVRWRVSKTRILAIASTLIVAATLIGKLETLQKANAPLFFIQILIALYLIKSNRITLRLALAIALAVVILLGPAVIFAVSGYEENGVLGFLFYRIFEIPNEILVEHFAAIPGLIPHTSGANIRPLAWLTGQPFVPTYDTVAFLWRGAPGSTSTAMFIGDAWDAFSYAGVAAVSLIAGALCRGIDIVFLRQGRTALTAAVLSASFMGVYSLLISSLQTAILSGGLLLCPAFAVIVVSISRRISKLQNREAPAVT